MKIKIWHTVVAFILVRILIVMNQHLMFGWKAWFIINDILKYANAIAIFLLVLTVTVTLIKNRKKNKT